MEVTESVAPENAEDGQALRRRIPLRFLIAPIVVLAAASIVSDWFWPKLVVDHPLLLIALNAKNRYLLLVAPQVGMLAFFVVGFARLVISDPLMYLIGRQYGETALTWIERKTGSTERPGGGWLRKAERLFGRAAPLVILVAPSGFWCMMAGAARMRVSVFVTFNVVGTIGRLALFWYTADAFSDQLEGMLDGIARLQMPLIALSVGIGIIQTIRRRRRRSAPATTEELDELAIATTPAGAVDLGID
jgi:membrane protein DedA with SNARE-associated domain